MNDLIMALKRANLTPQQYRTLKGQILAGDAEGAAKGLRRLRSCATCGHYLGGGNCDIGLEADCAAGNFEGWVKRVGVD